MKKLSLVLLFGLYAFVLRAQSPSDQEKRGDSLYWAGDYTHSAEIYHHLLTTKAEQPIPSYFLLLQKYAECLVRKGSFDEAEKELLPAIQQCPATNTAEKVRLLNTLGLSKIGQGAYEQAEDVLDQAAAIATENQNKIGLAESYSYLGILYWSTGNNEKALSYALNALELRQKAYGEASPYTAGSYMNLGLIVQYTDGTQAIRYYDKAIETYSKIFQPNHPLIASALINKGIVYKNEKAYNSSLAEFEKALQTIGSSVGKQHNNYAFALTQIGNLYLQIQKPQQAQQCQQEALEIFLQNMGERHPEVAECYNELAAVALYNQHYKKALAYYQQALQANAFKFSSSDLYQNPSTDDAIHSDLMLNTLLMKANALELKHTQKDLKVKDLKAALSCLQSADTLAENIRHRRTNKKDKVELGKLTSDLYEQAIHLCFMLSEITAHPKRYQEQAFLFSEKNKAAVLLEAISDAKAKSFAGLPDSLLDKENELVKQIAYGEQQLKKAETPTAKAQWQAFLLKENRAYEDYIEALENRFPAYYELKYQSNTLTAKKIIQQLPDSTGLLHYFISDKYQTLYIFSFHKKKMHVFLNPKEPELDKHLTGWRNAILYHIPEQQLSLGNILSKQLLPRKAIHHPYLIIVPDGRLSAIPFEALYTTKAETAKELPLLIKQSAVSYDYSAALYLESLKKSKTQCSEGNVLLCAPVTFHGKYSDLPGTQQEVKNLSSSFTASGFNVQSFLHEEANETAIKRASDRQWSFIHLATHGLVNEKDPDLSKILLHAHQDDDGELLSGEIYTLNLPAELITLSACQTGLGKVTKGEGLIGLSRALLYAGANNLIVSLWNVSDKATSQLMEDFYNQLLNNTSCMDYAKALQHAKLQLLANKEQSDPYLWAPFILIGK